MMAELLESAPIYHDRVRGVLFGLAVGDALGLGAEFMTRKQVALCYPEGLRHYDQIVDTPHTRRWLKGEWTDDTHMMLCILDSLLACNGLDGSDIARRWLNWARSDGRGVGKMTALVMGHKDFPANPQGVAEYVWRLTGAKAAPNGGVMRSPALGVWGHRDMSHVALQAEITCALTHADPRCVESSRLVALMIAGVLNGEAEQDLFSRLLADSTADARGWMERALTGDIALLDLDGSRSGRIDPQYGYTYKCLGVAAWALLNPKGDDQGIQAVIGEGGDADTNAAVAGAVLGARFGHSGIPLNLRDGLRGRDALEQRVQSLLALGESTNG
jgi:ADP-ribosylglycohydrolase